MSSSDASDSVVGMPAAAGAAAAPGWLRWVRIASTASILICLLMLVRLLPVDRLVQLLTAKVESLGAWGPVVFAGVYVPAAVLFVPGSALTLAAGAIFGLIKGTVVVSFAATTAAAISFLVGRYLARGTVRRWADSNPRFAAIDRAIGQGGWKIIALLRLSPAVPFSLGNYLYGTTSIPFWPYALASWLAMLPGTFMYVYLGYAGRASLGAASGGGGKSPAQWALLVVGLMATVVVTVYVTRVARKAIKESTDMSNSPSPAATEQAAQPAKPGRSPLLATALTAALALMFVGCTSLAYAKRSAINSLFGPPKVTLGETYAEKPGGPRFDHSGFDAVLKKHVDDAGGVDYRALKADRAALDAYVASLAKAPLAQMGRNERLTLLINAYNAFTLRLIVEHYPIDSIKDIPDGQRWDAKRWNLAGNTWSLNEIEHEQVRPHFKEPRIHFALVCAAVGCPPLRNEAYAVDRLEEQLAAQAKYVHTHDRWFQFDASSGVVRLTSLYDWYGGDFEQAAGSVLSYAAGHSPQLKAALDAGKTPKVQFLDYDWALNQKDRK